MAITMMKTVFSISIILCLAALCFVKVSAQQNKATSKKTAVSAKPDNLQTKIGRLLEQSGGAYNKVSDGIWAVPFKGNSLKEFNVIIVTDNASQLIISFVVIAEKKNLRISQNLLYDLLKYNHTADKIKIGINEDGDLILRIDENGRLLDLQAFKDMLDQTAAASDELNAKISSSIISPK